MSGYVKGDLVRSLRCRNCGSKEDHGLCNLIRVLLMGTRWERKS